MIKSPAPFPDRPMMRQLILDLLPESPPTLDNFVAGGNHIPPDKRREA